MSSGDIERHDPEAAVALLAKASDNPINIQLLLGYIVNELGGLEEFGKLVATVLLEMPAKSPARERMITNIMRLIAGATVPGVGVLPTDVKDLQEDLRQEMKRIYPDGN